MSTTEFSSVGETVTAVMTLDMETGESFSGPVAFGHYCKEGRGEAWIDFENTRLNIPAHHVAGFIKQLKRAAQAAKEAAA